MLKTQPNLRKQIGGQPRFKCNRITLYKLKLLNNHLTNSVDDHAFIERSGREKIDRGGLGGRRVQTKDGSRRRLQAAAGLEPVQAAEAAVTIASA